MTIDRVVLGGVFLAFVSGSVFVLCSTFAGKSHAALSQASLPKAHKLCAERDSDARVVDEFKPDATAIESSGTAEVAIALSDTGGLKSASINRSSGSSRLDGLALEVARKSKYAPGRHNCSNTSGELVMTMTFDASTPDASAPDTATPDAASTDAASPDSLETTRAESGGSSCTYDDEGNIEILKISLRELRTQILHNENPSYAELVKHELQVLQDNNVSDSCMAQSDSSATYADLRQHAAALGVTP